MRQEIMGFGDDRMTVVHMHTICTSHQTDNHISTSSLNFYRPDALPDAQPTASKHYNSYNEELIHKPSIAVNVILEETKYSLKCNGFQVFPLALFPFIWPNTSIISQCMIQVQTAQLSNKCRNTVACHGAHEMTIFANSTFT